MKPPSEKTNQFASSGPFVESQTATSWTQGVTRYQWLVLFVAWLGWVFDSMDATIYALVLHPALEELLEVSGRIDIRRIGRLVWRHRFFDFSYRMGHRRRILRHRR